MASGEATRMRCLPRAWLSASCSSPAWCAGGPDAVGFVTLLLIDIGVIRELAIGASMGVAVIILTNLILLL